MAAPVRELPIIKITAYASDHCATCDEDFESGTLGYTHPRTSHPEGLSLWGRIKHLFSHDGLHVFHPACFQEQHDTHHRAETARREAAGQELGLYHIPFPCPCCRTSLNADPSLSYFAKHLISQTKRPKEIAASLSTCIKVIAVASIIAGASGAATAAATAVAINTILTLAAGVIAPNGNGETCKRTNGNHESGFLVDTAYAGRTAPAIVDALGALGATIGALLSTIMDGPNNPEFGPELPMMCGALSLIPRLQMMLGSDDPFIHLIDITAQACLSALGTYISYTVIRSPTALCIGGALTALGAGKLAARGLTHLADGLAVDEYTNCADACYRLATLVNSFSQTSGVVGIGGLLGLVVKRAIA